MSLAFIHPGADRRETRRAARAARRAASTTVEPATTAVTGVLYVRFLRLRSVAAFTFVLLLGFAGLGVAAAVGAWHLAVRRGIVEDAETLMLELGFESFEIRADQLLDVLLVAAAVGVIAGTILAVVGATLFNLVSWVTGGIEVRTRERRPLED